MALADEFDGFLVDLDGVVWLGPDFVPGAAEALCALLDAGKEIAFVSNNPGRAPGAYAERLREAGVEVGEERVVTAGAATVRIAAEAVAGIPGAVVRREEGARDRGVFVIGPRAFKDEVAAAGLEMLEGEAARDAGAVLVAGHRGFDYEELLTATLALQRGGGLFATSRDPTMPMPEGGWPGTGAVLAAIETASGARAAIGGKPEPPLFELALDRLGSSSSTDGGEGKRRRVGKVAMVGDRVSSDVVGGRGAGLATILVLSGATSREQAERADPRPDHVVADLTALLR